MLLHEPEDATEGSSEKIDSSQHSAPAAKQEEKEEIIAQAETRAVKMSKALVFLVLLISTIAVALIVYFYLAGSENSSFEAAFREDVKKTFEEIGSSLDRMLGNTDNFMVSLVSYAKYAGSSWPFVTMSDFAVKASKLRSLTNAIVVGSYPVVETEEREAWENYTVANDAWVSEGLEIQKQDSNFKGTQIAEWNGWGIVHDNNGPLDEPGPYLPTWQTAPVVPFYSPYNWNIYSHYRQEMDEVVNNRKVVFAKTLNLPPPEEPEIALDDRNVQWVKGFIGEDEDPTEPMTALYYPVLDKAADTVKLENVAGEKVIGVIAMTIFWRELIKDILPEGSDGIVVVIGSECDQKFTYQIMGPKTVYLGRGDRHDPKYNSFERYSTFFDLKAFAIRHRTYTGFELSQEFCPYWIKAYPSDTMKNDYTSRDPILFTSLAILIFLFTSVVFLLYDFLNERRQRKVMRTAIQSSAIVSSLFPSVVRDRLFPAEDANQNAGGETPKLRLQSFLKDGRSNAKSDTSSPIAELFSDTTVMFADIAGFTAWSSVREPGQVFTLLEAIYGAFDTIAKRRGVFKVETIGDSYVAVAGLPEPNPHHALVMAKFARDCREEMALVTRELEVNLGPGTGDLELRFGLNSGPCTAGVLRGDKSRFQLFGDTVNTAARMESNGIRNKIHVTQSTADLLLAAGKKHWITKREELVEAKGKGKMQTYWVEPNNIVPAIGLVDGINTATKDAMPRNIFDDKTKRLINWNVDILSQLIRQIIARREAVSSSRKSISSANSQSMHVAKTTGTLLDEVKEIIELPPFDPVAAKRQKDPKSIKLEPKLVAELESYVTAVANMYLDNPFHNFEHASHVSMSVVKLMNRIIAPDGAYEETVRSGKKEIASTLHDYTYGITSDPLTQFACGFAALIHDIDHPGVPNAQLVKEGSPMASVYKNKSIAEQNSVDLAWDMLMQDSFQTLRDTICSTAEEKSRFRELVVNAVMATDIMDKDLKQLRNARWEKAFSENAVKDSISQRSVNRKATIVIEHLIQASDIAHTMQHWHIYRKWNECFFMECYKAYKEGRAETDPSENWYQGEIGFFDFYIIPLAKKLKDCGVFGVSCDEYLNYAKNNREEWADKGREVVAAMIERVKSDNE